MGDDVLTAKNVDLSNLKYSVPKLLKNGSTTVYINYKTSKLSIQTPIMRFPFGVGDGYDKDKDKKNTDGDASEKKPQGYDIQLSFNGVDDNPKMKQLLDLMTQLEAKLKHDAFVNRIQWLGDDYDGMEQVVGKLFSPILKYDKDKVTKKIIGKYPPTMKVKLPYDQNTDTFKFESYNMDGEEIDFKSIMTSLRGGRGKLIIQLSGLWFAGGKYGASWKVVTAKTEAATVKKTLKFIPDSDDENEDNNQKSDGEDSDLVEDAINNGIDNTSNAIASTTINDSEEESEDDDSDNEPPPPPPPVTKGKGKAKK